mmetsp:Transcript_19984/g.46819  ORF Transcript_19984/g.46819 Transcript_19984/m.46819 type:complete len:350 (+) Transcript_19984:493-1542(+)
MVSGAGIKDARLLLAVGKVGALGFCRSLDGRWALLQRRRFHLLHDPGRRRWRAVEEVLRRWDLLGHAASAECSRRVVVLIAIEVPAPTILALGLSGGLYHHVAVVGANEHIDAEISTQFEVVGRQPALSAAYRVSAFPVILLRVHGIVLRCKSPITGSEGGGVLLKDGLAVPEDLETLVPLLWANVGDDKLMIPEKRPTDRYSHGRARGGEALGVAKAAVNTEPGALDQMVDPRLNDGRGRSENAVERDDMRIPEDRAFAHDPLVQAHDLGDVRPSKLAMVGVNLSLAVAHALERHALRLVGVHDSVATCCCSAGPAAAVQRHVIERGATSNTHRPRERDRTCTATPAS